MHYADGHRREGKGRGAARCAVVLTRAFHGAIAAMIVGIRFRRIVVMMVEVRLLSDLIVIVIVSSGRHDGA